MLAIWIVPFSIQVYRPLIEMHWGRVFKRTKIIVKVILARRLHSNTNFAHDSSLEQLESWGPDLPLPELHMFRATWKVSKFELVEEVIDHHSSWTAAAHICLLKHQVFRFANVFHNISLLTRLQGSLKKQRTTYSIKQQNSYVIAEVSSFDICYPSY